MTDLDHVILFDPHAHTIEKFGLFFFFEVLEVSEVVKGHSDFLFFELGIHDLDVVLFDFNGFFYLHFDD